MSGPEIGDFNNPIQGPVYPKNLGPEIGEFRPPFPNRPPPPIPDPFQCLIDLVKKYGIYHHYRGLLPEPEAIQKLSSNVIGNIKGRLSEMTPNEIQTNLETWRKMRHKISDEVWNARIPGNGYVPHDYHQVRRSLFFDAIHELPGPIGSQISNLLGEMFLPDFQTSQQMVGQETRHKVLEVLDCMIGIISSFDFRGGKNRKKPYKRKTYKRKFIKRRRSRIHRK